MHIMMSGPEEDRALSEGHCSLSFQTTLILVDSVRRGWRRVPCLYGGNQSSRAPLIRSIVAANNASIVRSCWSSSSWLDR